MERIDRTREFEPEHGFVYQDRKRPQRVLVVVSVNDMGLVLKNEETEATHTITREGLPIKFRLIGKHVPRDGDTAVLSIDDWPEAPRVEGERTNEPADPPEGEGAEGAEPAHEGDAGDGEEVDEDEDEEETEEAASDDDTRENDHGQRPDDDVDTYVQVLAGILRGTYRTVEVGFKAKECRLFYPGHVGALIGEGSLKEHLEAIAASVQLHHRMVSSQPKPGELPAKTRLAPRGGVLASSQPKTDTKPAAEPPPASAAANTPAGTNGEATAP